MAKELAEFKAKAGKWWDADLAAIANHESTGKELFLFIYSLQKLCIGLKSGDPTYGKASKILRLSAWQRLDFNDNGIVSLAETGKWIKERLINFYVGDKDNKHFGLDKSACEMLYKRFYPSFIRAFLDAADYGAPTKVTQKGGGKSYSNTKTTGDDYVQLKEFRLLVVYLCIYATIWEAFSTVDGGGKGVTADDDRRVSAAEWAKSSRGMAGHPLTSLSVSANGDPAAIFNQMDGDGKGMVLLAEFSTYIEDYEFALKTRWGRLLNAGEPDTGTGSAAASAGP